LLFEYEYNTAIFIPEQNYHCNQQDNIFILQEV